MPPERVTVLLEAKVPEAPVELIRLKEPIETVSPLMLRAAVTPFVAPVPVAAEFIAMAKIVDRDDVVNASGSECVRYIAADHPGGPGHHHPHANSSS